MQLPKAIKIPGPAIWGAEFTEDHVRLVCLQSAGSPKVTKSFKGTYKEALKFAGDNALEFKGVRAAVSHLPFKTTHFPGEALESPEALEEAENKSRPPGLTGEDMIEEWVPVSKSSLLLQMREGHLQHFLKDLPKELGTLSWAAPSPFAYHRLFGATMGKMADVRHGAGPISRAALVVESDYTHVMFYIDGEVRLCLKLFMGYEQVRDVPDQYLVELKKALAYYWQTKVMGSAITEVVLFKDGPEGEVLKALQEGLDVPVRIPEPPAFVNGLDRSLYGALGMALSENEDEPPPYSVGSRNASQVSSRRLWLRHSRTLAKALGVYLLVSLLVLGLMASASGVMHLVFKDDKKEGAEAARGLAQLVSQRTLLEGEIKQVQGMLANRTRLTEKMQAIQQQIPAKMWLSSFVSEKKEGGGFTFRIGGYCFEESSISKFMQGLEKLSGTQSVQLKSTELVPAKTVQEITGLKANLRDLVQFQLVVEG